MKNWTCALLFLTVSASGLCEEKTIQVSTAQEFLDALGDNVVIEMAAGDYEFNQGTESKHYFFRAAFDGDELVIRNCDNLTIRGSGKHETHLITKPRYGFVLNFNDCGLIILENLKMGHGPEKGYCTGGVIRTDKVGELEVNDCYLYGSGTYGIEAWETEIIHCNKTIITECTYGIVNFNKCGEAFFTKCSFTNNKEFDGIATAGCNLEFVKCTFENNQALGPLIHANAEHFSVTKCKVYGNTCPHFVRDMQGTLKESKTKFKENDFGSGKYANEEEY